MSDDNSNPNGDWRASFGADAAQSLSSFKEPGDFFKSYQTATTELETLKKNPPTFDWRKELAGDDADSLKVLERFSTAKDFNKAYGEAVKKIRSGELAKPLAKDATEEQVAEWRKANGIPEKPEGYFQNLPNGLVIGQDDQELFNEVAGRLHAKNVSPDVMHELVGWYYDLTDKENAKVAEADKAQAREAVDKLREEWGADYRANMSHVMTHLDGLGKELKEQFMDATLPDGTRLFNSPEMIKWLAAQAREINPANVVTGSDGANQMQSIESEIASIEGLMKTDRKAYNADTKKQERLRQLYDAREKLKARAA